VANAIGRLIGRDRGNQMHWTDIGAALPRCAFAQRAVDRSNDVKLTLT
jgi:hypothetical protein